MDKLEKIFRMFTIEKLEALKAIVEYPEDVFTTTTISGMLDRNGQQLGGTVSSLSRTQIDNQPLIIPLSRSSEEGTNWRFNQNIASKEEIIKIIDVVLEENKKYKLFTEKK